MFQLISSIQHFFVVIFTAVTVVLPFHNLPAHPTPSPSPTIQVKNEPSTSPTPIVIRQTEQPTQNIQPKQPTITHDGTRTGNIIKYHELCTGQDISIYENELLEKKGTDGKTYFMTQGDWNCYNRANSQPQQNQQQLPPVSIPQTPQAQTPSVSVEAICKGYVNETTAALRAMVGSQSDWTGSYYEYAFANMYNYCLAHGGNMNGYQIPKPPPITNNVPTPTQDCSLISNSVTSLKSGWQSQIDLTTRAITSSLGARGLLPNSPEGQQALSQGLAPVYSDMNYQIAQFCLQILRQGNSCPCP